VADKIINQSAIDAANAANAAGAKKIADAQAKVAAFGTPSDINFTKQMAQSTGKLAPLAERITAKAATRPEVLAAQGLTLDQLKEKNATTQQSAIDYAKTVGDITDAENELTKTQTLYGTPVSVPSAQYATSNSNSAFDLLLAEFQRYGLSALVEPLKNLITNDTSAGELTLLLRQTPAYQQRFAANKDRIAKGLTALSEKEYLNLEDQYQNIMRNYGLPASYYAKGDLGRQEGFEKLLANDVSATELEDRVMTAQSRVINANPEVKQALRSFYPDITDGDILAYTLDPTKALTDIKRKVTAAEIGGAALGAGLKTSQLAAEGLAGYGVTKGQAQQGYGAIAEFLPTGEKLSQIYQESPYTQQQAEQEIFNLADSAAAAKKRKRLSQLETGTFSGSSGMSGGALSRDRAINGQNFGAGSY
jgi:hypothetical protein